MAHPRLRPVEIVMVGTGARRALVLRDTEGVAEEPVVLHPSVARLLHLFDGRHGLDEIASFAGVEASDVADLVTILDEGLMLESAAFEHAKRTVADRFRASAVREASHAGGAYPGDAKELGRYIDETCLGRVTEPHAVQGRMVGLVAPHIDPWRGATNYGHAYRTLRDSLPPDVDTFVVLGTSHAPMREPFALCEKDFATPFGDVTTDRDAVRLLAQAASFDAHYDVLNHKREHSIELQTIFLKRLAGDRKVRIVPILAGLGAAQSAVRAPTDDDAAGAFLAELGRWVRDRGAVLIAGADLAHVGPRFGDVAPGRAARSALEARDLASLALASPTRSAEFFTHVSEDQDERRVCGVGPMFSLLAAIDPRAVPKLLRYEQTIDAEDGSIVSHAAVAYTV